MRNQWYGDLNDLTKWSVLIRLAKQFDYQRIIQITYKRPSTYASVKIDNQIIPMEPEVIHHFRDLTQISHLSNDIEVIVFNELYSNRKLYTKSVIQFLSLYHDKTSIVFLDPDTGLEPRKPDLRHVTQTEIAEIFQQLYSGNMLAVYQHLTNRAGKPWIPEKKNQFALAASVKPEKVITAHSDSTHPEIAIFAVMKE